MKARLNFRKLYVFIKIVFIYFSSSFPTCESVEDVQSKLRRDLLNGYDPMVIPKEGDNATQLFLFFYPYSFNLDEKTSIFTLTTLVKMMWYDSSIHWDPAQYKNLTRIGFQADELWKPDLTVYNNAAKSDVHYFHSVRITAYSDGRIYWSPPSRFETMCVHNLKKWPFDKNTCYVRIGSWSHSGADVFMVRDPKHAQMSLKQLMFNPDWKTTKVATWLSDKIFECCPKYQEFGVIWQLERRPSHPFAIVCVPAIVIAIVILTTFWMNPSSVERSALLFIALTVNSMFLKYVYDVIPPNGDDVPLIILYYSDSLAMVALAILWTVVSRYIALSKRTSNVPLPQFIVQFLESWPSKVLCIASRPKNAVSCASVRMFDEDDTSLIGLQSSITNDWAWLAHLLDRIVFALYVVIYFTFIIFFL